MKVKRVLTVLGIVGVLTTFIVAVCLATGSSAYAASGNKTLAEYDAEIATQEQLLEEKEAELETKRGLLQEAVKLVYCDYSAKDMMSILVNEENLIDALRQIEYIYQISDYYQKSLQDVADAKVVVEETIAELDTMRMERQNRAASADEAELIQYSQSGQEWSSLPYWGVSISRAGCGLCAYTSIIDILTDSDYTPADMLKIRGDWRGMDHYVDDDTGTPDGSSHHDFTLNTFAIDTYKCDNSADTLADELSRGESCVMLLVHGVALKTNTGGTWYTSGHFINVFEYDEDGNFHVHDSASSYGQGRNVIYSKSDMQKLMSGATAIVYRNI